MWTAAGDCVGTQPSAHRGLLGATFLSDINCGLFNYNPYSGSGAGGGGGGGGGGRGGVGASMGGQPVVFSLGSDSVIRLWDLRRFRPCGEINTATCAITGAGAGSSTVCSKGVWAGQNIVSSGPSGAVCCWSYCPGFPQPQDLAMGGLDLSESRESGQSGSSGGWRGRRISCHAAPATDLISTETFVASSAKNGQILVWTGQ